MSLEPASATPSRMPTWLKVTLGCGLLLALAVFAVLGLVGYGFYWMISPGPQMATRAVIGPGSTAVVQTGDLGSDAGMRTFLQHAFNEIQRLERERSREKLPPFLEGMQKWNQSQVGTSMMQMMPRELTVSFEPAGDGERARPILAINFRQYVRPVRYFVERTVRRGSHQTILTHRGHTILVFEKNAVCFRDGTVIFAADADAIRAALDRDAAVPARPEASDLAELRPKWDLSGRTTDPETTLPLLLLIGVPTAQFTEEMLPAATRFGLDLQSADTARGFVELTYPSPAAAAAAAPLLTAALATSDWAKTTGARVQWTGAVDGEHLKLELRADGLAAAFTRYLEESQRTQAERRNQSYGADEPDVEPEPEP